MAQSSPIPRVMPLTAPARRCSFSTIANSFMEAQSRGQLFTKDLTHRGQIASGFGFEVEIRERAAHRFESVWRQIARAVARHSRDCSDGVGGLRNFEKRVNPTGSCSGRQHLINGSVEQLAGAQAG